MYQDQKPTSSQSKHRSGAKWAAYLALAAVCVFIGIIIAANIDMTGPAVAEIPTNIRETGLFPVVERDGELESPFVSVVHEFADGVVNISARTRDDDAPWWLRGTGLSTSLGSGFFFRKDGYVLTNNHVVKDAVELTVRTATGYEYAAQLVGADPQTDLAVIKVEPEEDITVIPFGDSEEIQVGDWAIAIGNPFPQQGLDRSVTVGVVSAKGRSSLRFGRETPQYQNYIQTDAAINPGNSGGPLLNLRGEVIGVNAAISSPTGSSVGIGFAIPINLARAIVPDLIEHGKASRGWLGVWLNQVTEREAKRQGLSAVRGVKIDSVLDNSPAERGGIEAGDVIVSFNGQEVLNPAQFQVLVSTVREGTQVPLKVMRDGDLVSLTTGIGDRETFVSAMQNRPLDPEDVPQSQIWMGMEMIDFTEQIADDIGAEHVPGLYVVDVYPGTPADRASIAVGTVVLKIDNRSVKNTLDLARVDAQIGPAKSRIALIVQEPDGSIARKVIRR
ncbi:PDZ domain-containing protein [candidate division GN15 bacterium]|nr:PDZ domain-containing protein [candidate division GN15 bacterium]